MNLNEGLKKFIVTSLKRYQYKSIISELLPFLDILRFDEETSYREQTNIQTIYHTLLDYSLKNNEVLLAKNLLNKYFVYLKRYVYIEERLRLLGELVNFIERKKKLPTNLKHIKNYIKQSELDGYSVAASSQSDFKIISDSQVNQAKSFARRKSTMRILALLDTFIKNDQRYKIEDLISKIIPSSNASTISDIRKWCKKNNVEFLTYSTLSSLLEFSIQNANKIYFRQTKRDILDFCKSPRQLYIPELIKRLDELEFDGKKVFLRKLIRCSLERAAGSSYYLNYLILHTSDVIDRFFPELKGFAFEPLKETVENSMRLSLSKS